MTIFNQLTNQNGVLLLGRIAVYGIHVKCTYSVCVLITRASCTKSAEPIEMPFGVYSWEHKEPRISWRPGCPRGRDTWGALQSHAR